jgi:PAS domain S-box-containing protein
MGVAVDITDRKLVEFALREKEVRLEEAADVAGLGFYEVRSSGFEYQDERIRAIVGLSEQCTTTAHEFWLQRLHPEDRERILELSRQIFAGEYNSVAAEYRFLHPQRGVVWLRHLARVIERDAQTKSFRILGVMQEITESKLVEEALRESVERFRQVAEIAGEFIWEVDANGRYTYASPSVEKILGYTADELVGKKHFYDLFEPSLREHQKAAVFRLFAERQTFRDSPHATLTKSGKLVFLETSGSPMLDAAGNLIGYRGADTDITKRKQHETEVHRSRAEIAHLSRVAMLGELSGSLAHELNQPLTAILSNAQAAQRFLAEESPDLTEVREILKDIVAEDQRAGEVIRRLRLLLKKGEYQQAPLDVNEVVQDVLKLIRNELLNLNIALHTDFADHLPLIMGDRVQLQQVLLNLIMNAGDAMANVPFAERRLTVQTALVDRHVRVSVADRGMGIPPDVLEQMFVPFFTTKATGLGLGLPVSRTIISTHGGHLTARNNPDRGAIVEFLLPVHPKDKA